jgi:hypothetical protein
MEAARLGVTKVVLAPGVPVPQGRVGAERVLEWDGHQDIVDLPPLAGILHGRPVDRRQIVRDLGQHTDQSRERATH